ncbi:MAG TPA: DsbA family protein [Vitreimonas sp.]|nr:DsbA family protein [Vitreimonas sp.]
MKNVPLLIVTLLGTLALIFGVAMIFSQSSTKGGVADLGVVKGPERRVKGKAEAQVTITEFSDFQCPACKAISPLIKQVADQNPDTVKVNYRHFPLTMIHPYATLAAQASEAAGEQGKFWEMHDLLFANQETWAAFQSEDEARAEFEKYAEQLGLDKATFVETIQSDAIKQNVANDIAAGNQLRVSATPTIFVNDQQVPAPQQLQSIVESELQKVNTAQ